MREAIGETDFEPQQILGYAPIEPDGSFKLHVPADTPIGLTVIDNKGRGVQTHLNWIQVRPGERRTCLGCHSPRRGASINSGTVVDTLPAALNSALASSTSPARRWLRRARVWTRNRLVMSTDMEFTDVWATGTSARAGHHPLHRQCQRGRRPAHRGADRRLRQPPDHVQPLWTRDRGANTCTNCHTDPARLDLRGTISGTGRVTSYEELVLGDPVIDPATGLPQTRLRDGEPRSCAARPLVETMAPASSAWRAPAASARSSSART